MTKIVSKRERERIQRELEQRIEEARRQLADGQDLIDRLSNEIKQMEEDAWMEHILEQTTRNVDPIDINYIQTGDAP